VARRFDTVLRCVDGLGGDDPRALPRLSGRNAEVSPTEVTKLGKPNFPSFSAAKFQSQPSHWECLDIAMSPSIWMPTRLAVDFTSWPEVGAGPSGD